MQLERNILVVVKTSMIFNIHDFFSQNIIKFSVSESVSFQICISVTEAPGYSLRTFDLMVKIIIIINIIITGSSSSKVSKKTETHMREWKVTDSPCSK